MAFWKKKQQQRQHYRTVPPKKIAFGAYLEGVGGTHVHCQVADVSAGGVGLVFSAQDDPRLEEGGEVMLGFQALALSDTVRVQATVVGQVSVSEGVRYGFRFGDLATLFDQLDSQLFKVFNRRTHLRVLPQLGTRLKMMVQLGSEEWAIAVNDVSIEGVGFVVDESSLELVQDVESFSASLHLPGMKIVKLELSRRHLTGTDAGFLVGSSIEVHGGKKAMKSLQEYIDARAQDMARWDQAYES